MYAKAAIAGALLAALPSTVMALDANCAPGGNFDLTKWSLQLPVGDPGKPTTINSDQLTGCDGYENFDYFFTESGDGALVMKVPSISDGCVKTPNSKHCRTELRESNPSTWDPNAGTNRLNVTLAVETPDDSEHGTVIGQIHIDDSVSSKPVCELYYNGAGDIAMGVEQTRDGGNSLFTDVGHVDVGTTFSYDLRYEGNVLSIAINGGDPTTLDTYDLDAPASYFKVGNYNQGSDASDVHFFSVATSH